MPRFELIPFSAEHLDDAAALLAERHARHREAEPLLPEVGDFRAQIEAEWREADATGVVARAGGDVLGYLVGRRDEDANWGKRVWIGLAGHASRESEIVRDLYAALADAWVDAGHVRHQVMVPASDAGLLDAWLRLGFTYQHAYGIRETTPEQSVATAVEIRPGREADLEHGAVLDRLLWEHQLGSPSLTSLSIPSEDEFREDWSGVLSEPEFTYFVAELDGRIVGHALLYRRPAGDLRVPEASIDLANAVTFPEVRGAGVGRALTEYVLGWAHRQGYRSMTTDWRIPNLLSSRFWPARGFRTSFLRLYRSIP